MRQLNTLMDETGIGYSLYCKKKYMKKINAIDTGFQEPKGEDKKYFHTFNEIEFGDCSFTLIYAWQKTFQYFYKSYGDVVVVLENGLNHKLSAILLYNHEIDIIPVIEKLYNLFSKAQLTLRFAYVSENELNLYKKAAEGLQKKMIYYTSSDYSDYIYETKELISLSGGRNKGKRGDLNHLLRQYPDIYRKTHGKENDLEDICMDIFNIWCSSRQCKNCIYGCEKKAFSRFMEIFDPEYHKVSVSFVEGKPLSFAASERIGKDMVCYYFQKNVERIRGLTYWLNREMAVEHEEVKYVNLGEDMGLRGLREDKSSFHPCYMKPKYWVEIL